MHILDLSVGYEEYPRGDGPPTQRILAKVENTILSENMFLIGTKETGPKKCPSLNKLRKISKIGFNNVAIKQYNNYIESIL